MKRSLLIKALTIAFALFSLYYLVESIFNILYFYPQLFNDSSAKYFAFDVQENLFQRAIYDYFSLLIYSFLSLTFITTPEEQIKNIHLLAGVVIFVLSFLFFREGFQSNLLLSFVKNWYWLR